MITRLFGAVFASRYPKGYTGRHRARLAATRSTARTRATASREAPIL